MAAHSHYTAVDQTPWSPAYGQRQPITLPAELLGFAGTGSFTLEFWCRIPDQQTNLYAYGYDWPGQGTNRFFAWIAYGDGFFCDTGSVDAGGRIGGLPGSRFRFLGQWAHVALVVDAAAGQQRLYVNGELHNTVSSFHLRTPTTDIPLLLLGGAADSVCISEFRYWSLVRSLAQIIQKKNSLVFGPEYGLEWAYRCHETGPSGTLVKDWSGNGRHGFLT